MISPNIVMGPWSSGSSVSASGGSDRDKRDTQNADSSGGERSGEEDSGFQMSIGDGNTAAVAQAYPRSTHLIATSLLLSIINSNLSIINSNSSFKENDIQHRMHKMAWNGQRAATKDRTFSQPKWTNSKRGR